jgi:Zn-dependent metalloprotease
MSSAHATCAVVPPYLLNAIAQSPHLDETHKAAARFSLTARDKYIKKRTERLAALTAPRGAQRHLAYRPSIVPDFLLKSIIESDNVDEETKACAQRDLEHIQKVHASYQAVQGLAAKDKTEGQQTLAGDASAGTTAAKFYRAVYDAKHDDDEDDLPGTQVRLEGQDAVKDESANEAYDNCGHVLDFYAKIFNWKSIDNQNMHVISSVHFAKNYENACE